MHAILQTISQSHAHRLLLYATSPHLKVFSTEHGVCDGVEELGTHSSDYSGPCLLLLKNCRVQPKALIGVILSTFLRGYIVRIYWCEYLIPSRSELLQHIQATTDKELVNEVRNNDCMSKSCIESSKATYRIQSFPRDLAQWMIDGLPELEFAMHGFTHCLYTVEVDGIVRYGIGKGQDVYLTPCDREALSKGYVARACLKLEETLHIQGIELLKNMVALDVGAAPGAWTDFLSQRISHVIAVDPGQLNIERTNVTHLCKKAQDSFQNVEELMQELKGLDLLVCDVNKHPVEAANIVAPLLTFLNPGGILVLTLKFHGRGKNKSMKEMEIEHILEKNLNKMECVWLLANSIYERTFIGYKK